MSIRSNNTATTIARVATVPDDDPSTITFWILLNQDLNTAQLIWFTGDLSNNGLAVILNTDGTTIVGVEYTLGTATAAVVGPDLTVGTWYHVALVRNGTSLELFINGASVGSTTISISYTPTNVIFFNDPGGTITTDFTLSHARHWTSALTAAEILAEMNFETAQKASPWATWEFNSGAVTDSSGNGRDLITASGTPISAANPPLPQPRRSLQQFKLRRN